MPYLFSRLKEYVFNKSLSSLVYMQTPIATVLTDRNGVILNVNSAFQTLTGHTRSEILGERMSVLKSGQHSHDFYKHFWQKLMESGQVNHEICNRCKDGTVLLMREQIVSIKKYGKEYFLVLLEDITEQKKLLENYLHLATHDPLTGLANRTLLQDRFSHACSNAIRNGKKIGFVICDLDEFKQCNDKYGHSFGDEVLKEVAKKLKEHVRSSDTVARYGGDEFILILEQIGEVDEVCKVVNALESTFPISFSINDKDIDISIDINMSIGSACFPDEGTTFDQLLSLADFKMYKEKNYCNDSIG